MTVLVCRTCGHHNVLRSRFEAECTECGSEDLELEDAYDEIERQLRCEYCGYAVDTTVAPSHEWEEHEHGHPLTTSVDDPCPVCDGALVPASEAKDPRKEPESKLARGAARKVHREHKVGGGRPFFCVGGFGCQSVSRSPKWILNASIAFVQPRVLVHCGPAFPIAR